MSNQISVEQFQACLPKQVRKTINPEIIKNINTLIDSPGLRENYRENLLSYTSVMADGKFKIQSYIDAVRYVSYKLLGSTNLAAYTKTFPDRFQKFITNNTSDKDISSYVAAYNKTRLVNLIFEQTLVPSHVLNADLYQNALNVQANLMNDETVSPKIRSDAANSLLVHLKAPETTKVELDIGVKEDKTIDALRASTMELVKQQKLMLNSGIVNAEQIAHSSILIEDGEVVN